MDFRDMRNSFNLLLIALSLFDTCYLAGAILESMRKSFGVHSEWQTLLFPGRHAQREMPIRSFDKKLQYWIHATSHLLFLANTLRMLLMVCPLFGLDLKI